MLRFRRDPTFSSLPPNLLLEPGVNSLRTPSFTADSLFGRRIQAAITADQEDQVDASLARNNSGQHQGAFKRPVSKSPAAPPVKNAKKNNFFPRRSFIQSPAPNSPSSYQIRSSSYQKLSGNASAIRAITSRIRRLTSLRQGRTSPRSAQGFPPPIQVVLVGARLMHCKSMAQNNFGPMGSFLCYKMPHFSI
ncbi:hypothetical protein DPMN_058330 [Dreissena polymorpha]|uniref:Uncharacterized protein n=1 Tax=Dreissena polymorpha TaxID=45954 RepID=A0A9D4C1Z1_DREPO|nr:hypothetical protein DPMN_058330 [Dreissena polymorpha]